MELNTTKTREMILGPINKTELPRLTTPAGTIERVNTFKLLGVHIESSLSWSTHISNILKKLLVDCTSSSNSKELDFLVAIYFTITPQ